MQVKQEKLLCAKFPMISTNKQLCQYLVGVSVNFVQNKVHVEHE